MSDEVIEIKVAPRPVRTVKFLIAGTVYGFSVPKMYKLMDAVKSIQSSGGDTNVAMFEKVESWLFDAMDPAEAGALRGRLLDEQDELDVEHLTAVFQELIKAASNRPSG